MKIIALLLALAVMAVAAEQKSATADKRPNIVFIMADDLCRQAVSAYDGDRLIRTPNIDRLAKDGIRFTHAMAGNSICSPSRAMLLTGKYNHLCGVRRLSECFDGSQQTFPKLLQAAGYQTALIGKWHLNSDPTGFDYFSILPGQGQYYDSPFITKGNPTDNNGKLKSEVRAGYVTDVITDVSLDWLKHHDSNKPFCLMIHHKAPHSPHLPAARHKELFKDTVFPEPPNLVDDFAGRAPGAMTSKQVWSRLLYNDYPQYQYLKQRYTGDIAHDTRLVYQEYLRGYLRLVAALDENVGRVLDYLDQSGLAANTVVIFTSDNGFFLGEHGFYNKMWMYEEGFSLPMIVRLPGSHAGTTNAQLVSILDLAPTVIDVAGAKIPADIQGCSLKPLWTGESAKWRDAFYYHYYGTVGAPSANNWIAHHEIIGVRTATGKLVYYPTWKNGPFWEYFDLTQDPREMHNLYRDPSRQKEVAALKAKLLELADHYKDVEVVRSLDHVKGTQP